MGTTRHSDLSSGGPEPSSQYRRGRSQVPLGALSGLSGSLGDDWNGQAMKTLRPSDGQRDGNFAKLLEEPVGQQEGKRRQEEACNTIYNVMIAKVYRRGPQAQDHRRES